MEPQSYSLTPEEECKLIDDEFADLLQGYIKSNHRKKVDIIDRAFKFASCTLLLLPRLLHVR